MASRISRRSRCNSASLDLTIVKRTAGSAAVASTSKMDEAMINSRSVMPLWWFLRSPFVLFIEAALLQAGRSSPSRRCWARTRPFLEWNVLEQIGKQEDRAGSAFNRQSLGHSVTHLLATRPGLRLHQRIGLGSAVFAPSGFKPGAIFAMRRLLNIVGQYSLSILPAAVKPIRHPYRWKVRPAVCSLAGR